MLLYIRSKTKNNLAKQKYIGGEMNFKYLNYCYDEYTNDFSEGSNKSVILVVLNSEIKKNINAEAIYLDGIRQYISVFDNAGDPHIQLLGNSRNHYSANFETEDDCFLANAYVNTTFIGEPYAYKMSISKLLGESDYSNSEKELEFDTPSIFI